MASVTSLDQDMKRLRLGRYTPQAANEARTWIEESLGERLPPGDLLDALKDGTVLCRHVLRKLHDKPALTTSQACKSRCTKPRSQVQEIRHAVHTDGKYLPFPPRMRAAAVEHAVARQIPHRRPLRI